MFRDLDKKEKYMLIISFFAFIVFEYFNQKLYQGMGRRIVYISFLTIPIVYIFTKSDTFIKVLRYTLILDVFMLLIFLFPLPKTVNSAKTDLENKYKEEMDYDSVSTYQNEIEYKLFDEFNINYIYQFNGKNTGTIYLYNPNTSEIMIKK